MGSYWFENKNFYSIVISAVNQPNAETIAELESILKNYRIRLLNLFKHTTKNSLDRQKVQSASRLEGIKFDSRDKPLIVPQQYVDESLILSDLFDLNEILALQLVIAAQKETAEFPDFGRGFCAIYLYYKNQWYLAEALKTLMFGRSGAAWQYDQHPDELKNILTTFTEQLWKDGFMTNVLELLSVFDVSKELDKLLNPSVKGLGNAKHKKMVTDAIIGSCVSVADALFYWICQTPLSVDEFASLMRIVRNLDLSTKGDQPVSIGRLNISIVMSALQSIDVSLLENVQSELGLLNSVPFIKDGRLLNAYNQEITSPSVLWVDPQLEGLFCMVWAVTLRILGQHHLTQNVMENFTEDEEDLLDRGMKAKPFHWIRRRFLNTEGFFKEEFFCRRLHSFFSQLLVNFPIKIKEWRASADEECHLIRELTTSGETPSIHFEQFLYLIGDFYKNDDLQLNLASNFFCPIDYSNSTSSNKTSQTQVSLFKFVRESGEALPPFLYVAYLHMLNGLCCDDETSGRCFSMLKGFANYGSHLTTVSLDHFFAALGQYYRTLRAERSSAMGHSSSIGSSCHIAPDELKGLQSWLDLLSTIARHNDRTRISFCDESRWSCLSIVFGLLGCPVPLELKGKMFKFLSSLARSPELAQILFDGLISSGIVSLTPDGKLGGIQQELDELETRNEVYPATTGLLDFFGSLMSHGRSSTFDGVAFRPYFNFVVDSVLVQFQNRSYKNAEDLWNLGSGVAKCLYHMIETFDVTLNSVNNQTPGCQLMSLMICDSPVFRTVVAIIDVGVTILDQYVPFSGKEKLEETTLFLLKLILAVLDKQELFISYLREVPTSMLTSSIDVLLQTMNQRTREPDYPTKIASYLSFYDWLPEHCLYAVKILSSLHKTSVSIRTNLLKYFCTKTIVATRILNGFASCLNMDEVDAPINSDFSLESNHSKEIIKASTSLALLEFLIECIRTNVGQPNVAHFLLGFDIKKPVETMFQNPGVNNTPKTCLHGVLSILESFVGQNLSFLSHGALVEPAYRLLYWLASQKLSGEPTLRYLRSQHDFIFRHASRVRLENEDSEVDVVRREIGGWLMKLTALELKSSSQLNHRSNINRFLKFFFTDGSLQDDESNVSLQKYFEKLEEYFYLNSN